MVWVLFASGQTTAWFFAPILHCTRLPCLRPLKHNDVTSN